VVDRASDQQELNTRIRKVQEQSDELKKAVKGGLIPQLEREIADLQVKMGQLERIQQDIAGCWTILLGARDFPTLNVVHNDGGDFEGVIIDRGRLAHIRPGHRLFSVARINATTYDGTEHTFSQDGQPTRIPLRLVVSSDFVSMSYRSDQVLSLRRCD